MSHYYFLFLQGRRWPYVRYGKCGGSTRETRKKCFAHGLGFGGSRSGPLLSYVRNISGGNQPGLIHLLSQALESPTSEWKSYVSQIKIEGCRPISMISSGDALPDYVERVRSFSWSDFFEHHGGGATLDRWRNEWKSTYDFVLIDSRTGITDLGGVCTIFLPDILVLVFTANDQSFEGALKVARGFNNHVAISPYNVLR